MKKAPTKRLRDRFIRAFALLSLAVVGAIGFSSIQLVIQLRVYDVAQLEQQLIDQKIAEAEKFIADIQGALRLQVAFEERAEITLADQKFLLERLLSENDAVQEASFLNFDSGIETYRVSRERVYQAPDFRDRSTSPEFLSAKAGKDYLGPIRHGEEERLVVTLSSPVRNRSNELISVLTGDVDISALRRQLVLGKLGNTGYLYVVDQEGKIFAHSREAFSGFKKVDKEAYPQTAKLIEDILRGTIRTGIEDEDRFTSTFGEDVIAAGKRSLRLGWAVAAEWPEYDAMEVVGTMTRQIVEFSLVALAAVVMLCILLVRQITRPLGELTEGAAIIGKGNLNHRIKVTTKDEIGELARSFNTMARGLKEIERLREIEIRNKALAETLRREQELSQTKDKFISVASHQLRTPISVLRWTVDLLRGEKGIPASLQDSLADMHDNVKKLNFIVSDLLTVSEFGLGYHKKGKADTIDLSEIVGKLLQEHEKEIKEKDITVRIQAPSEKIWLSMDLKAAEQVAKNLVDNAITYTREHGFVDVIFARGKDAFLFSVKDTGIGVPRGELKMVFSQFFRATNSVEQKNVGTGLGLYVTKNIVEAYGGKVGVESEEGKGSTFWFHLPLSLEDKSAGSGEKTAGEAKK